MMTYARSRLCDANILVVGALVLFLFAAASGEAIAASTPMDPIDKCVQEMERAAESSARARLGVGREVSDQSIADGRGENKNNFVFDIGDKYCFSAYYEGLKNIREKIADMDPLSAIAGAMESALNNVLNEGCTYGADAANAALESICLPLPSIAYPSLSLNLPPIKHKYCDNGLSPADVMHFQRLPMPRITLPIPTAVELFDKAPLTREMR